MEIQMQYYLVVSTVMFFAGVYGFVTRRNLIAILLSIELILNAVNINFAVFNRYLFPGQMGGSLLFDLFDRHCSGRDAGSYRDYRQYLS